MSAENLTRAVLTQDGRVLIEQPDGSYRPAASRTDWDRVRTMSDEAIEAAAAGDPDAPPLDEGTESSGRLRACASLPPQPVRPPRVLLFGRAGEVELPWAAFFRQRARFARARARASSGGRGDGS
jgi:hypothetical protein